MILAHIDASKLQAAIRDHLKITSRSTADVLNSRMKAVLMRAFTLLPPQDIKAERAKLKAFLTREIEQRGRIVGKSKGKPRFKKYGRDRQYQFRHQLAQIKGRFSGSEMGKKIKSAAGRLLRKRINAVGYVKGLCAHAIRTLGGGTSSMFGSLRTRVGKYQPSASVARIAGMYSASMRVIGRDHKGYRGAAKAALNGVLMPNASVDMASLTTDKSTVRVAAMYSAAAQRAVIDETAELIRHMTHVQASTGAQAGFKVVP